MSKIIKDFYERLSYGSGPFKTKVTITEELTGAVDEFYIFSKKHNFDDVKNRIRRLYSGDSRYNPVYEPYAEEMISFMLSEPYPSIDAQKTFYAVLRDDFIKKDTQQSGRWQDEKKWDKSREKFDKAIRRHIDRILETASIVED